MLGRSSGWVVGCCFFVALGCAKGSTAEQKAAATSSAVGTSTATPAESATATKPHARARSKATCNEILTQMEKVSKDLKMAVKTTPGSWGKVPKELQVLPPGAQHCGSVDMMDQAVIASPLAGKDMEAFYAPLFAKMGCQPLKCEEVSSGDLVQTRCNCRADDFFGSVNTDTGVESYSLAAIKVGGILARKKH